MGVGKKRSAEAPLPAAPLTISGGSCSERRMQPPSNPFQHHHHDCTSKVLPWLPYSPLCMHRSPLPHYKAPRSKLSHPSHSISSKRGPAFAQADIRTQAIGKKPYRSKLGRIFQYQQREPAPGPAAAAPRERRRMAARRRCQLYRARVQVQDVWESLGELDITLCPELHCIGVRAANTA